MSAPDVVRQLIQRFSDNQRAYKGAGYKEAQLRQEFIDPLFEALGWDLRNRAGNAESFKDVVHEEAIKIGGTMRAPDYSFRVGGRPVFFVEVKKPAVNLKDDEDAAFQLRRYAWSAKLPISILTDFEEFVVYDTRIPPKKGDTAAVARLRYDTFTEYDAKWGEITGLFSKEAVLKGGLERFVQAKRGKKGTDEVDQKFLAQIEEWRGDLAKNLKSRNKQLDVRSLNFAVQRIIDRIVFLRICEDRGIESQHKLEPLLNGANVYGRLKEIFEHADDRYNSGLFHFKAEKDRHEPPDELTLGLKVDDDVLQGIIKGLYYPQSPYDFRAFPAEILGQVYEQFLGKVIRLTDGGHVKVEDKPEVKKAGGVYYTPSYIVEYIVTQTVGKLLEGKTPKDAAKITVLDPACGSGSFLIGAYQHLLDWHREWYEKDGPEKHKKELFQGPGGVWRLTTSERKRILLNSIYGVDIDPQAVEVTKLSLLLKVLEGESAETINQQFKFFHERALPDLGENVKCGNSLIGPEFIAEGQMSLLDDEDRYHINVFDWADEFVSILRSERKGFDAIIGNPPYIPTELIGDRERSYFQRHFRQIERKYDTSVLFILAMIQKLSSRGLLSFISSVTWQTGENYARLRQWLFTEGGVVGLVNLPFDVFKAAYVDTGVYVLSRSRQPFYTFHRFPKKERSPRFDQMSPVRIATELVEPPLYKVVLDADAEAVLRRIAGSPGFVSLGDITESTQGLAGNRFESIARPRSKNWFPYLEKGQVGRYSLYKERIGYVDMSDKPTLQKYYQAVPKILIRRVISRQDRLLATISDEQLVFKKDINPFLVAAKNLDPLFLLSLINSQLISYLYLNTSSIATKDDFRQTTLAELRRLRVPSYNRSDQRHLRLGELASKMLGRFGRSDQRGTEYEKAALLREATAIDREIDRIVYELYGLTDAEIKIVEEATRTA